MSKEEKVCSKADQGSDFHGYNCLSIKKNKQKKAIKNSENEENGDDGTQRFRESLAR